jgi:hypothetical protein
MSGTAMEALQSVIAAMLPLTEPTVAECGLRDLVGMLGAAIAQPAPARAPADAQAVTPASASNGKQGSAANPAPRPAARTAKMARKRRKAARRAKRQRRPRHPEAAAAVAPEVAPTASRFRVDGTAPAVAAD